MVRIIAFVTALLVTGAALTAAPLTLAYDHGAATPEAGRNEESALTGTGAAFMVIQNTGAEDDVLLDGESEVAQVVEVHEMAEADGVMQMRPLLGGLTIAAGSEETLEPGSYHFMLIGLREDLTNGKTYDLTLHFQNAGEVTVPVTVRPRAKLAADATPATPVTLGEITVSDAWSRPAPATGLGEMGTPEATPQP